MTQINNIHPFLSIYFLEVSALRLRVDIFTVERMRVLKGESGRVILKMRLPKMSDCEFADCFNSLYTSLIAEYTSLAERLSRSASGEIKLFVTYTVSEAKGNKTAKGKGRGGSEERLLICRNHEYSKGADSRSFKLCDEFDMRYGFFKR